MSGSAATTSDRDEKQLAAQLADVRSRLVAELGTADRPVTAVETAFEGAVNRLADARVRSFVRADPGRAIGARAFRPRASGGRPGARLRPSPVWVDLKILFPPPFYPAEQQQGTFVNTTREVRGVVHGWRRGGRGLWLAVCSFDVEHLDGRVQRFERQLVQEGAVRLRDR